MTLFNYSLLYIDPGMGSIVVQALIGGVVAGWIFFKNFWHKFFPPSKDKNAEE